MHFSRVSQRDRPTLEVYHEVMAILSSAPIEYRRKILSTSKHRSANGEYYETALLMSLNIPLNEWESYDIDLKARIYAYQVVKNMVEIIDRHYDEQDRLMEERTKKRG